MTDTIRPRILVRENIGEPGINLLKEFADVETGFDWDLDQLQTNIADFDGIIIRSATKVTADLLSQANRLRVIGRAGVGVDNVDLDAATRRGILVVNAPQSNIVTAAEHTIALMLALARNIPQAHAALVAGRWERSKFSGVELQDKVLGVVGFGRIGQLVAERAQGLKMKVVAFDPFVSSELYREFGVEKADSPEDLYEQADFVTIHLPKTAATEGFLGKEAFEKMRPGVRVLNVARGGLIDETALQEALDSGKVAGAALDVFPSEPMTEHPLFGYTNVVVTPHLGASTTEATGRAGFQVAQQVAAAFTGKTVSFAVNAPSVNSDERELLAPFIPLAKQLGQLAVGLAAGSSIERIESTVFGRIGALNARLLTVATIQGVLQGRTEGVVNDVNALSLAEGRGIVVEEKSVSEAKDYHDLLRVTVLAGDKRISVAGTIVGARQIPHLVEVYGQNFTVELAPVVTVFRYEDIPGMIGRVGTTFGEHGVNIDSAAVGRDPEGKTEAGQLAAMVVTTDNVVERQVIDEIVASEGFVEGRCVVFG